MFTVPLCGTALTRIPFGSNSSLVSLKVETLDQWIMVHLEEILTRRASPPDKTENKA